MVVGAVSLVACVLWYGPNAPRSPCDRTCVSGLVRGRASSACAHGSDRGPRMSPSLVKSIYLRVVAAWHLWRGATCRIVESSAK
jgi:hypothetical protein